MGAKGMNSVTLAEKVGVSKSTVSYWLTGRFFPDANKLKAIAGALGVEVWQLFKDPDSNAKDGNQFCAFVKYNGIIHNPTTLEELKKLANELLPDKPNNEIGTITDKEQ